MLAFFRRLGWVLFLLIWLTLELAERLWPSLQILNIKAMLEVEHHGTQPLIRWSAWQLHGLMAAGALVLAARLWLVQPEVFTAFYQRLIGQRLVRRLALGFGMFALALVAVPMMVSGRATTRPRARLTSPCAPWTPSTSDSATTPPRRCRPASSGARPTRPTAGCASGWAPRRWSTSWPT